MPLVRPIVRVLSDRRPISRRRAWKLYNRECEFHELQLIATTVPDGTVESVALALGISKAKLRQMCKAPTPTAARFARVLTKVERDIYSRSRDVRHWRRYKIGRKHARALARSEFGRQLTEMQQAFQELVGISSEDFLELMA